MRSVILAIVLLFVGNVYAEHLIRCGFYVGAEFDKKFLFGERVLHAGGNARVFEGSFIVEDEYLHYRLSNNDEDQLGLRVRYTSKKTPFEKFYVFEDRESIQINDHIEVIDISFKCNGAWNE